MRTTLLLTTLALLAAVPIAAAQNDTACPDGYVDNGDGTCSRQAWVDDCPPDMMCAAGSENGTDEPIPYGNESCIECSGPAPVDEGSTCMDGAQGNETCSAGRDCVASASSAEACGDDVQYLDGGAAEPTRGPADGSCENCRGEESGPISSHADASAEKDVPGLEAALVFAAVAGAVLVALRRK